MTGSASLGRSKRPTSCTGTRDRCQQEPRAAAPLTTVEHLNPQLGEVLKHAGSRAMTHGESAAALVAKIGAAEHANGARRRLANLKPVGAKWAAARAHVECSAAATRQPAR